MGILKNIEWVDNSKNTIVHKFDFGKSKDQINKGSALTVREGQQVIFVDKGRLADVFLPGFYKLDTSNLPILTKLMSWKYGFETPFKSDIVYVVTTQFTNCKWGTVSPILLYDPTFGNIGIRGRGTFSFKVSDAGVLLRELLGSGSSYETEDSYEKLRTIVITGITDAFGSSEVPVSRFAGNLREIGKVVQKTLDEDFQEMGLTLVQFNVESFLFPEEVQKAIDENAALGARRGNWDLHTQNKQLDVAMEAAKNPGAGNSAMGAGLGLSLGMGMGNMFSNTMGQNAGGAAPQQQQAAKVTCSKCGAANIADAKFCAGCGAPLGNVCPKCNAKVADGAKFCPSCGNSLVKVCPKCKAELKGDAKFCPQCGGKV
jgi:membrane protease subunit (stomatin/prohibitin family)